MSKHTIDDESECNNKRAKISADDLVERLPSMLKAVQEDGTALGSMTYKAYYDDEMTPCERLTCEFLEFLKSMDSDENKDIDYQLFFGLQELMLRMKDGTLINPKTCSIADLQPYMEAAPFGDIASNATAYDEKVRKAFQIKDFDVSSCEVVHAISTPAFSETGNVNFKTWAVQQICCSEEYRRGPFWNAGDIRLIPHAINVYSEECHFAEHVDTQRHPDMIGTLNIITNVFEGGVFCVRSPDAKRADRYFPQGNNAFCCVSLRATCPHSVEQVISGLRISITFDVLGTFHFDDAVGFRLMTLVDRAFELHKSSTHLGITLTHLYTPNDIARKRFRSAFDAALVNGAGSRGKLIQLMWKIDIRYPPDQKKVVDRNVVCTLNEQDVETYANALFFSYDKTPGFAAFRSEQESTEWSGNECVVGRDDAVYLITMLMIARS